LFDLRQPHFRSRPPQLVTWVGTFYPTLSPAGSRRVYVNQFHPGTARSFHLAPSEPQCYRSPSSAPVTSRWSIFRINYYDIEFQLAYLQPVVAPLQRKLDIKIVADPRPISRVELLWEVVPPGRFTTSVPSSVRIHVSLHPLTWRSRRTIILSMYYSECDELSRIEFT
ncbi:unnamed protein product, partial [Nesidiocoris tenuis]